MEESPTLGQVCVSGSNFPGPHTTVLPPTTQPPNSNGASLGPEGRYTERRPVGPTEEQEKHDDVQLLGGPDEPPSGTREPSLRWTGR